jgi:hypothetical protein
MYRFSMEIHTTGNVMFIASGSVCRRYCQVKICFVPFHITYLALCSCWFLRQWMTIQYYQFTELEARDTMLLSKLFSKCDEALLGCEPRQAAWDGWSGVHVGGNRHVQGWRHDPCRSVTRMPCMLPAIQSMIDYRNLLELRSEEWPLDLVDVDCICFLGKQTG